MGTFRSALLSIAFASCGVPVHAQAPRVVASSGAGAWGESLRLVEDLRIGVLEGAEAYSLGAVGHLAVGADGSVFVGESRPARLRIYNASGRHVRDVGRLGEGPGEYRQIDGLKTMADGRVAVWDGRLGRISVFDAKGEFVTSHRLVTGFFSADVFHVDRAGNFYVRAPAERAQPGSFTLDRRYVLIKLDAAGQVVDSIPIPALPPPTVQLYGGPGQGRVEPLLAAFSPLGYFVTGDPREYAFELQPFTQRAQSGTRTTPRPTLRIQRSHTPVSLTSGERDEWAAMAEFMSKQPIGMSMRVVNGKPDTIRGPTVRYMVPPRKPAFRALSVDPEGTIWVERHVPAQRQEVPPLPANAPPRPVMTWREPQTFDLFDPGGRFLGSIVSPRNVSLRARRGSHVYGVMRGEFDENYIVRYRIEPVR